MSRKISPSPEEIACLVSLILSAALLCLIVYQDIQVGAAGEALTYLREHCQILP